MSSALPPSGPAGGRLRRALAELDGAEAGPPGPRSAHDWVVDATAFALAVVVGFLLWGTAADAAQPMTRREGLLFLVDAGFGVLACLALWWRRRWPVALAVVANGLGAWSAAAAGAGLVLVWTVTTRRRLTTTVALVPLLLAAAAVYPLVHPDDDLPYAWDLSIGVVITAAVVFSALYVRARRQLAASLLERARLAAADRERQVAQARQLERARIAREMHDVLAHRLSLVSLHAGALEYRPDAPPEELAHAAGVVRRDAHQALQDLRAVVGVLRDDPEGNRPQPTLADLPALVEESRDAGLSVRADYGGVDLAAVPVALGRTAYRIVQEGLTNARKHAGGVAADLAVRGHAGRGLTVELRNPLPSGCTAGAAIPGGGTGLVGLAERSELAGGRLEHGPTAAGEFRLCASLPWPT